MKDIKIIIRLAGNSLQQTISSIPTASIFFIAKIIRYGMFMGFLFFLVSGLSTLGGYSREEMLLFYLVFNLIDTTGQMLFREVYRFRPLLISGNFDFVLSKPANPLLRVLMGGPDFIDLGILVLILGLIVHLVSVLNPTLVNLLFFSLLIFNSLLIAAALHIMVLAIGILTLATDNLILIYRDLASMVRIPVDLYVQPLKGIITFVIPLGIMFTYPPKMLLGLLTWEMFLVSLVIGIAGLFLAIKLWNYSLRHYQSTGS